MIQMTTPDGKTVPGVHFEDGWVVVRNTSKGWVIDGWYATRSHARCCANLRKVRKCRRILCWDQPK